MCPTLGGVAEGLVMRKRAWVIVSVVAALVVATSAALYLTGTVVGDPFSGVWNADPAATLGPHGTWVTTGSNPSSGYLFKRTSAGYFGTSVVGAHNPYGWFPYHRHGWTLSAMVKGALESFTHQPWNGHLISTTRAHGHVMFSPLTLKKVTSSTSIPPRTD
jgi:hypothetical protein